MVRSVTKRKHWRLAALTLALMSAVTLTLMAAVGATPIWETGGPALENVVPVEPPQTQGPSGEFLTINVELTDLGFQPVSISIPEGRRIQLLVRNLGRSEHHFHVLGFVPRDMLWLATGQLETDAIKDKEADEHAAHHYHDGELVPFHTCTTGICPTGDSVHAHADPGEIDVVWFTAANKGTFDIVDPLNPDRTGSLTVY